jgi:hypothetical protein
VLPPQRRASCRFLSVYRRRSRRYASSPLSRRWSRSSLGIGTRIPIIMVLAVPVRGPHGRRVTAVGTVRPVDMELRGRTAKRVMPRVAEEPLRRTSSEEWPCAGRGVSLWRRVRTRLTTSRTAGADALPGGHRVELPLKMQRPTGFEPVGTREKNFGSRSLRNAPELPGNATGGVSISYVGS